MNAGVPPAMSSDPRQRQSTVARKASPGRPRGGKLSIVAAQPADYAAIFQFLTAVFQRPGRDEFRASLGDPFHEPTDRLLIKSGPHIVGHAHITHRLMQFGSITLPANGLHSLGVVPEYRDRGCGHRLLAASESHMAADGALVGLLRTRVPHFFQAHGWVSCCRNCRLQATARNILAGLESVGLQQRQRRLNIRPWRRMELDALMRIYTANLQRGFGPFHRNEAYWRWLITRKAFDQIHVALDGLDPVEFKAGQTPIVGYAALKDEEILEMFAAPGCFRAAVELLARACDDAIESDRHAVVLRTAPGSRIHKLFRRVGGRRVDCSACGYDVLMAKILDPIKLIEALANPLRRRARATRLTLPTSLGFLVEGKRYRLTIDRKEVDASTGHLGRSYLRLSAANFTRLLLGRLDSRRALDDGRAIASTQLARQTALALFRRHPFWRPPLDEMSV